ncbi:DUF1302 domain-containing protein [Alcanivorax sp. S6407]|uniref:DUF1302 domain-containing protein n=1 Tax=Alcanivorax sp. S6407 TaxID=2926424 RepID=UPI001FF57236|nr:DUF1302 domain-containing protein [Alcanivorax sp. S6407]MCK0153905.1 DUF1302 domain-containing protein [Alcanivorax sp. S6407]
MNNNHLRKTRLAMAVASISALGAFSAPASAIQLEFENPDWQGRIDTTLSVGALFRTESQDPMLAATDDVIQMTKMGYGSQINKNDANNNFDTGLASLVYKITPELDLSWQGKYGMFLRGTAFYDQVIMDGGHDGGLLIPGGPTNVNGFNRYALYSDYANNGTGDDFTSDAERYAGERARLLDAYVWGNFDVFERPLNVRLGQQVINWGEALFMQNGINTANYFDLNALRLPGSEIKEALLPLDSVYFSYGLTYNATLEGFYQFEWKNSEDAPTGTYFSTHDAFPGKGADNVILDGRVIALSAGAPGLEAAFDTYTSANYSNYQYESTQVTVDRIRDLEADDNGQFGLAYRYFAENLNGTEFALYYTRTHARTPVVGARLNNVQAGQGGGAGAIPLIIDTAEYQMAYAEDQDMFGFSFNTMVGNMSLAGEVAYRPERAIINEGGDNLIAALAGAAGQSALSPAPVTLGNLTDHCVRAEMGGSCLSKDTVVQDGQLYYFYDEVESYNGSLVSIFNFGPTFGSDGLVALLELGVEHIEGLENEDLNYNSTAAILDSEAQILSPENPDKYYMDPTSWGYRAVVKADYSNVFAGISMSPSFRFAHDVNGNSPIGGNFMEDRKAATLGVNFVYLNNLEVGMSGTTFWGADYSNKLADRNNASVSVKYSF